MGIEERAVAIKDRVTRIILTPKAEWAALDAEPLSVKDIYLDYVVYLAAIPAVANFLGPWLFGSAHGAEGAGHASFFAGLTRAILQYALGLPILYLVAVAISRLAPSFEGESDDLRAFKLVAFSYTPIWLAEIFGLVPGLRWLDALGLYAVYLFHVGVARLTRSKPEYSDVYTAAALVIGLAAVFLHGAITQLLAPAAGS